MKVVAKFALAFFVASCVCLVAFAYDHARREVADLQENVELDLRSYGKGLREGIAMAWASEGEEKALEILNAARGSRRGLQLDWSREPFEPRVEGGETPEHAKVVALGVPVDVKGRTVGAIVLRRPIPRQEDVLRASLVEELNLAAVLAVVLVVLAIALGGALIGRPLARLAAQAKVIGYGDFSQRLVPRSRDEIGALTEALNAMCDQLAQAKERLDREAAARIETLEQLRHLDRLRTVGTLASSLAHELGTPLNVLLLRGQAMANGELGPEELPSTGRTISTQVEKMSRIVRQLLDFARCVPVKGDVRLSEVARQAESLLSALARKDHTTIQVVVREDVVVTGAAAQLEQAVTNLVVNGIHAMPHGGTLSLTVGSAVKAPPSNVGRVMNVGYIEVRDGGVGMNPEVLAHVFEPFYTTKPSGQGTGLGLTVARGIAEDHEGWIEASSELSRGSAFTLYVPLAR